MFSIPVSLIFRHLDGYVPDELFPISPNSNNNNNNIGSMSGILNFLSLEEDDIFQIFSLVALEGISIYYYYSNEIVAGIFLYPTKSTWHSKRILLQRLFCSSLYSLQKILLPGYVGGPDDTYVPSNI